MVQILFDTCPFRALVLSGEPRHSTEPWYSQVNHLVPQGFSIHCSTIWYHRALVLTGEQFGTIEMFIHWWTIWYHRALVFTGEPFGTTGLSYLLVNHLVPQGFGTYWW